MSEMEMVNSFIQLNGVKRFEGYQGAPKMDRNIVLNRGVCKRERTLKNRRTIDKFGQFIERNY
jgi:hypothetical protein